MGRNPVFSIEQGDRRITVLGTAHISRSSADKVRELLLSGEFDAVAVELGTGRYKRITEPESVYNLDLFHIVKSGMHDEKR